MKPAKNKPAVLVCGADQILLQCRGAVLQHVGFDVKLAQNSAQAAEAVQSKQFSLAVLCYTLPPRTRNALLVLCYRFDIPIYEVPVMLLPDELVRAVEQRTVAEG